MILNKTISKLLPENTHPEFYFFKGFRYDYHLVFYCHDEQQLFTKETESASSYRESKARYFMNILQRRLGLREGELIFFGSSEFGESGQGHFHLLVSFDNLRRRNKIGKLQKSLYLMKSYVNAILPQIFPPSVKVGIEELAENALDQMQILSYVCKIEEGRDFKHCFYPRWIKLSREN